MKLKIKKKVPHMDMVKAAMAERNWTAAELSRQSGVSTGVLSRYLNAVLGMSDDNLFAVMTTLGIINKNQKVKSADFIGWSKDSLKASKAVREIMDYGDREEKDSLWSAIKSALKIRELKKRNAGLSSASKKKSHGKRKAM
jgi:transcriptional regulator with XRE-family HTH domain